MIDSDLAALYQVQTSNLNKAVKRNIDRFPEDFMFQLTEQEASDLTFHNGISRWGGRRTLPYAFTEHGVAMLSAVLHSKRAVQTSVMIVRAFVRMRELVAANKELAVRVEKLERGHERTGSVIEVLVEDIDRLAGEVQEMRRFPRRRNGRLVLVNSLWTKPLRATITRRTSLSLDASPRDRQLLHNVDAKAFQRGDLARMIR